ncbi:hypothetical protein BDW66DRAFT_146668 [Aspergillus desertorum]
MEGSLEAASGPTSASDFASVFRLRDKEIDQARRGSVLEQFSESQCPTKSELEALLGLFLKAYAEGDFADNDFIFSVDGDEMVFEVPGRWLGFLSSNIERAIRYYTGPAKMAGRMPKWCRKLSPMEWVASMTKILENRSTTGIPFSWTLPTHFSSASMICFSYSKYDAPMVLDVQVTEMQEGSTTIREVNGAYGRVWRVKQKGDILTVDSLLFLICQLHQTYGNTDPGILAGLRLTLLTFLNLYIAKWQSYPTPVGERNINHLSLQFHFRVFSVPSAHGSSQPLEDQVKAGQYLTGIRCQRSRHTVPVPSKPKYDVELAEGRCSIYLSTLCIAKRPVYQVLFLYDFGSDRDMDNLFSTEQKQPATRLTGVEIFDTIESILAVEMQETLQNHTQEALMYNRARITIKSYFTVLQTLRICRAWIYEFNTNLDNMWESMNRSYSSAESGSLSSSWDTLKRQREETTGGLLGRIGRIEEEFKSLQDGYDANHPYSKHCARFLLGLSNCFSQLMNITSIVVSTKSSIMNRYILIFTIATILYLPMSFVTSIFGMHLFDYSSLEQTRHAFYITMALASALTYFGPHSLFLVSTGIRESGWKTGLSAGHNGNFS